MKQTDERESPPTPARRDEPGEGRTQASKQRTPGPRLPHERDQSADSQDPVAQPEGDIGARAHEDIERGLADTDRGPVLDETYHDQVLPGADPSRRQR